MAALQLPSDRDLFLDLSTPKSKTVNASALSVNYEGLRTAVVGRDVFVVVDISQSGLVKSRSLRSEAKNKAVSSCTDVHWQPFASSVHILTGSYHMNVAVWDVTSIANRPIYSNETEHQRSVNCVRWHPTDANLALSGDQDGAIVLWDMRARGAARRFREPSNACLRVVKFCPNDSNKFAVGAESGNALLFDLAREGREYASIKGTSTNPVLTLDWHPAISKRLAVGRRLGRVSVYDTERDVSRAVFEVEALSCVSSVRWRPGHANQFATCGLAVESRVHVWDVTRPFVPVAEISGHKSEVTSIEWVADDADHLLSVSRTGHVRCHAFDLGYKYYNFLCPTAASWAPDGTLSFAFADINRDVDRWGEPVVEAYAVGFEAVGSAAVFRQLAAGYELYRTPALASVAQLCTHNAAVCTRLALAQLASTWSTLAILAEQCAAASLDQRRMSALLEQFIEVCSYYADMGDAQNAACMATVIHQCAALPRANLTHWLLGYFDLLYKQQMFVEATALSRDSPVEFLQRNTQRGIMGLACPRCGALEATPSDLHKCPMRCGQDIFSCSVCHSPVEGLYVWCQGCGHGGHRTHLRQWFAKHNDCPVLGCSHQCQITSAASALAPAGAGAATTSPATRPLGLA